MIYRYDMFLNNVLLKLVQQTCPHTISIVKRPLLCTHFSIIYLDRIHTSSAGVPGVNRILVSLRIDLALINY